MKDFDKWLTDRIEFNEKEYLSEKDGTTEEAILMGVIVGLGFARDYLRDHYTGEHTLPTKECSHYWVKTLPVREDYQAYMCLNCDLHKIG